MKALTLVLLAACSTPTPTTDAPPASSTPVAAAATATATLPPAPSAAAAASSAAPSTPPEKIAAQHVLVAFNAAKDAPKTVTRTKADAKKRAEEVQAKAAAPGADFSALVAEYSDDPAKGERQGSLGVITPAKVVKPFADAAFALPVDGVSGVVETAYGFHVIKRNQ